MSRKKDSGLGMEVFFPPSTEESNQREIEAAVGEKEPGTPEQATEKPREKTSQKRTSTRESNPDGKRTVRETGMTRSEERSRSKEEQISKVKLTVMVEQDKFDQLEELKLAERRRLRESGEGNWRVTITQFVDEALEEFLARKGAL